MTVDGTLPFFFCFLFIARDLRRGWHPSAEAVEMLIYMHRTHDQQWSNTETTKKRLEVEIPIGPELCRL